MSKTSLTVIAFSVFALVSTARAQTTTFTYQGELKNGSALANGPYDMRFTLFNSSTSSSPVGSALCFNNISVVDGRFTVRLEFGQVFITTSSRFLNIEVRPDDGSPCLSNGGYIPLSPRQQITAAPFANHAKSAFSLAAGDGSPADAVIVDSDGRVGMGTPNPSFPLHIVAPEPVLALQDSDSTLTQTGYISLRDISNAEKGWIGYGSSTNPHLSIVNARASADVALVTTRDIVMTTAGAERIRINTLGNVGIGLTPGNSFKLDVAGSVRCTTLTQTSSAAFKDDIAPLHAGLLDLMKLEPVSYVWNDCAPVDTRGKHDLGFIAEEVAAVLPDAVSFDADGKAVGIDYSRITVLAVKAIKEQQVLREQEAAKSREQIRQLFARLERLEAQQQDQSDSKPGASTTK